MATDKEPFEEFDELLTPILEMARAEVRNAQAPPDFLARSMEKIRQLPAPRRRFSGVKHWLSWSRPVFAPAFAMIAALVMTVSMVSMYDRIEKNEDRIRAGEIRHSFTRMTKKDSDELIRPRIELSTDENITLCRPQKAKVQNETSRLFLLNMDREFSVITFDEYETACDGELSTTIYLPESVLKRLNIDESNLGSQEIHIYEKQGEPKETEDNNAT